MSNIYFDPKSNHSPFEQAFLHAVRAIIACDDARANGALNEARRQIVRETPSQGKFNVDTSFLDPLYGDNHYGVQKAGPWIRCPEKMALIGEVVAQFGDLEDKEAYNRFVRKSAETFKRPYATVLAFEAA